MTIAELAASLSLKIDEASFAKGSEAIEGIHKALEALAVAEGVKKLYEMVEATEEFAVSAKRTGEKLGITAQSVQELGYAADVSGASMEDIQRGMQKLALASEQVKTGQEPLVQGLGKLKISFSEIQKLPLDEKLARIADGFADAGPDVDKTGISMEIFGKAGTKLIPLLNKGADGLAELKQEFIDTGAELDDHAIESFEHLEETQKKLHWTLIGLRNQAVAALLPELQSMADGIMKWVSANRELIKQKLEQIVHALIAVFKVLASAATKLANVFVILVDSMSEIGRQFDDLVGGSGVLEDVLVAAAVAIGAAWVAAEFPFLAFLLGITAIILVVQDLWSWLNGGDSVLKNLYNAFVQYLGETGVGRIILGVMHSIHAMIDAGIAGFHKLQDLANDTAEALAIHSLESQIRDQTDKQEDESDDQYDERVRAMAQRQYNENKGEKERTEAALVNQNMNAAPLVDPWHRSVTPTSRRTRAPQVTPRTLRRCT